MLKLFAREITPWELRPKLPNFEQQIRENKHKKRHRRISEESTKLPKPPPKYHLKALQNLTPSTLEIPELDDLSHRLAVCAEDIFEENLDFCKPTPWTLLTR